MVLKQKNPYWTAKAKEDLKEITKYYKKEDSINMAHKKVKDLKHYADLLADNPLLGFYEQALSSEPQGFRSLVHACTHLALQAISSVPCVASAESNCTRLCAASTKKAKGLSFT